MESCSEYELIKGTITDAVVVAPLSNGLNNEPSDHFQYLDTLMKPIMATVHKVEDPRTMENLL